MSPNALVELCEKASPNTSADGIASSEPAGALGATLERVKEASVAADFKPRLARFVSHPLLAPVESKSDPFLDFPTATSEKVSSITGSAANLTTITTDTNINELESNGKQSYIFQTSTTFRTSTISFLPDHSSDSFNDSNATLAPIHEEESDQSASKHSYPPSSHGHKRNESVKNPQDPHNPVPATVVFARYAFPLSLPKLDRYLSSLPPPYLGDESDTDEGTMFPPLDQLAKTKKLLEDLESNSVVAPTWRNPTSILNSAANLLISLLVRQYPFHSD